MTPSDIATITRVIGPVMREFTAKSVSEAVAPLLERNAALELRIRELETQPAPVAVGPVGPVGLRGEPGIGIASLLVSADGRLVAHLTDGRSLDAGPVPRGEQGERGERGEPGPMGPMGPMGLVGPPGDGGERGEKGDPGIAGRDGAIGPQGEPGIPGAPGERGEKGLDGIPGRDGRDGQPGAIGEPGPRGADGLHGKDGRDGIDGKDGLGFDDFDLFLDEARGWILRLAQGDRVKEWELGIPYDTGKWEAGRAYAKGAGTQWDGHYWLALKHTTDAPSEGHDSWRMIVRRGKQGREGKPGKDGPRGRDLTQIDPATGQKW